MCDNGHLTLAIEREVENVASTETVTCCTKSCNSALLECVDYLVEGWACLFATMSWEPNAQVKLHARLSKCVDSNSILRTFPPKKSSGTGSPFK